MLKKTMTIFFTAVMLSSLTGCGGPQRVIEVPNDNMFGIEKISVYKDKGVIVFNKAICDDNIYDDDSLYPFYLQDYVDGEKPDFKPKVTNLAYGVKDYYSSKVRVKADRYVVTLSYDDKDSNKLVPDKDMLIYGFVIDGVRINLYGESIEMKYYSTAYDSMTIYTQYFDSSKGSWSEVEEEHPDFGPDEL